MNIYENCIKFTKMPKDYTRASWVPPPNPTIADYDKLVEKERIFSKRYLALGISQRGRGRKLSPREADERAELKYNLGWLDFILNKLQEKIKDNEIKYKQEQAERRVKLLDTIKVLTLEERMDAELDALNAWSQTNNIYLPSGDDYDDFKLEFMAKNAELKKPVAY